jgi:hypothetical protein
MGALVDFRVIGKWQMLSFPLSFILSYSAQTPQQVLDFSPCQDEFATNPLLVGRTNLRRNGRHVSLFRSEDWQPKIIHEGSSPASSPPVLTYVLDEQDKPLPVGGEPPSFQH